MEPNKDLAELAFGEFGFCQKTLLSFGAKIKPLWLGLPNTHQSS